MLMSNSRGRSREEQARHYIERAATTAAAILFPQLKRLMLLVPTCRVSTIFVNRIAHVSYAPTHTINRAFRIPPSAASSRTRDCRTAPLPSINLLHVLVCQHCAGFSLLVNFKTTTQQSRRAIRASAVTSLRNERESVFRPVRMCVARSGIIYCLLTCRLQGICTKGSSLYCAEVPTAV